jgi:hypothetical protein
MPGCMWQAYEKAAEVLGGDNMDMKDIVFQVRVCFWPCLRYHWLLRRERQVTHRRSRPL